MTQSLFELSLIVIIATALGFVARLLRQPTIIAFIATGVLFVAAGFVDVVGQETFKIFSELGIMFLLFLVGMQINYTSLRLVGRTSVVIGIGQIVFTSVIGFFISRLLSFGVVESLYIAVALTFSSTIIILKLLTDRKELNSLYGKISVGFLLVQDLVAILLLIFLTGAGEGVSSGNFPVIPALFTLGKGIVLFIVMFWAGRKLLPKLFDRAAKSEEFLFLLSLAWLFLVAAAVSRIGFSIEIAGFLAGVALANSSERHHITSRIAPLRDFFIVIFFVILGSSVAFGSLGGQLVPILVFSLFILIGNPLIVLVLMGLMGYRKRTGFFAGITVAQISEFSLILMALGLKLGHVGESSVAVVTAVGAITIAASGYIIMHADAFYRLFSKWLSIFEKKKTKEIDIPEQGFRKPIVLVGCHRVGESIAASLPREDVLVVDFDPDVVQSMSRKGYAVLFGDITDREVFDLARIAEAKLVISTSPDFNDGLGILESLGKEEKKPKVILRAETDEEAKELYRNGADYVLFPHLTSGQYLGKTIAIDADVPILEDLRRGDMEFLDRGKK